LTEYEIIIIGTGAAGLTAGIYAVRAGLNVLLLEKDSTGGQLSLTELIENFPGFPEGIEGQQLAERFRSHALKTGLKIVTEEVEEIASCQFSQASCRYTVKTRNKDYMTQAIILACGAIPKRLGVSKEEMLTGRGVSYCATCDGPLFRNRDVVVVGGGNAACEEALFLSKFVSKVTLVHRRNRLRAVKVLQDRVQSNAKIEIVWHSVVREILGKEKVSAVKIEDITTGKKKEISCAGIFIFVGFKPNTDFLQGFVELDNQGFIVTNENLETSRKGIFACGDCRKRRLRQIITACGEGAEAAEVSRNYVETLKGTAY
jgi:thioredoxin reductase (NADPH)